jgi:S1-C subfamily serine protease
MKLNILLFLMIFSACTVDKEKQQGSETTQDQGIKAAIVENEPQHSSVFLEKFTQKAIDIISTNQYVSFSDLQKQKLKNIEENSGVTVSTEIPPEMSGNELYFYIEDRTLVVGSAYKGQFEGTYLSHASAFVIHEDGVVLTNYHVVESNVKNSTIAIFVSDKDGNVYPVTNVLCSSQANDLAVLKIDTKGKKLKTITFAPVELVGDDIYMMGHPFQNTYFMSKGIVARKYISERDDEPRIAVTCDYGQGASGGPIVNTHGQIIGMVSSTYIQLVNNDDPTQMVIKEAVPVSTLWKYVKRRN